jgi:hypothetical protein
LLRADALHIQGRNVVSELRPAAGRRSAGAGLRLTGVSGATLCVRARDVLAGNAGADRIRHNVYALLADRVPVAITIAGLGDGQAARDRFGWVCEALRPALARAEAPSRSLQITVPADAMTPLQAWSIRRRRLGPGRVNLLTTRAAAPRRKDGVDAFWRQLWQLRGHSELLCAFAANVWPTCPLLTVEHANAVEPWLGLLAPVGTAWVWAIVRVDAFADAGGRLDHAALQRGLEYCVEAGETLHDDALWPTAVMRQDSWRNRRIAILLTGLGEIVARRKVDPRAIRCHDELEQLLAWIRSVVTTRSRRLASQNQLLPALNDNDPMRRLAPQARAGWQERWSRALESEAVRHRNLLAMSPWSVIPALSESPAAYFDLLSLLAAADACTFQPPCPIRHYNLQDFIDLYAYSRAALARGDARRLFAEQI